MKRLHIQAPPCRRATALIGTVGCGTLLIHAGPGWSALPANEQPEAIAILRDAGTALQETKTIQADVSITLDAPIAGERRLVNTSCTINAAKPNLLSMHSSSESKAATSSKEAPQLVDTVSDGKAIWRYSHGGKYFHKESFASAAIEGMAYGFTPFNGFFDVKNSILNHVHTLEKDGRFQSLHYGGETAYDGMICKVVELKYDEETDLPAELLSKANGKPTITETYYFGPDSLMRRLSEEHNVGAKREFDVSKLIVNGPSGAVSQFTFVPPAGIGPEPVTHPAFLAVGSPAPDFTADSASGAKPLRLSDYRGKLVVLDFWATWCGPCQAAMPHVARVRSEVQAQGVEVIGVCVWDDRTAFDNWLSKKQSIYPLTFAFDPAGKTGKNNIAERYKVSGIPTTYVIDKGGKVAAVIEDYHKDDTRLETALTHLGVTFPTASLPGVSTENAGQ